MKALLLVISLCFAIAVSAAEPQRTAFVQSKAIKGLSRPLQSQGQLVLFPDAGLLYRLEKPVQAAYLMSPQALVIEEAGQLKTLSVDEAPWLRAMAELLPNVISGNERKLSESFVIEKLSAEKGFHWRCVPRDAAFRQALPMIEILGEKDVEKVRYADRNGQITELMLQPLPASAISTTEQRLLDALKP